ncbi:NlpC/P60 family protein [Enterococcus dongliensis]|uniref:C40 family peptidase n=1 Tax=Enterococcus dongliensis TaxID=2559925 RepID=UPI00288E30A6|nr:NlpC/P60 family protein [Enterococcus dongliensis]MDT2641227.1 NlpC/P60 family protein [Enterococcus dongliensis]
MANIQTFINRMIYWCQTVSLGYDQSNRNDFRDGGETDCSALVIHALKEADFDTGNATYTGNMRANLTARGWKVVPNSGSPQAGDILLNDVHHVAVYIGNGKLAQASIDERGRATGGQGGDQTGRETNISNYYNYPWNCYLRWSGSNNSETPVNNGKLTIDGYWGPATTKRLQEYFGCAIRDGIISGQVKGAWSQNVPSIQFGSGGSNLIRAMQKWLGVSIDGNMGPGTIKALQKRMGTTQDGIISAPSDCVKVMQRRLNESML